MFPIRKTETYKSIHGRRTGRGSAPPPPHIFADCIFLHANARHSKPKVASRCKHAANIAFDLFNFFLYVIARKVRKCPLSPFVTSNVVLSCLVRMADILARLAQKADSLSALQLTGALWYSLSNKPTPPLHPTPSLRPPPNFLDRSTTPAINRKSLCIDALFSLLGHPHLFLCLSSIWLTKVGSVGRQKKAKKTLLAITFRDTVCEKQNPTNSKPEVVSSNPIRVIDFFSLSPYGPFPF